MSTKKAEDLGLKELYTFMLRSTQLAISVGVQLDVLKEILIEKGILDKNDYLEKVNSKGGDMLKNIELLASQMERDREQ
jgi:hypothetical protein